MKVFQDKEFWFITGSQNLYGTEVLEQVAKHSQIIADSLNETTPANVVCKGAATTAEEIFSIINEANYSNKCAGIITWMHTFSPSKMWINALCILNKPLLHFHTQFNAQIPFEEIDMDFMNLNQSAHGDREHGFIGSRLRLPRKIVVGHWTEEDVKEKINAWMRSAIGIDSGKNLKIARFGDNMREVAVTEGDKVEAQIKFGWSVNTYAVGDLADWVKCISEEEIESLFEECRNKYEIITADTASIQYQLRIEAALKNFFQANHINGFTTTFEDLCGLQQLPGLASQRLMEAGYGFGAEGDWKTAALLYIMKVMQKGMPGGSSFIEDYTYHLVKGEELVLGAHMLEVCPSVAGSKVLIDTQPLGIGGKAAPARMVFEGGMGKGICVSLVDMGGRMRIICSAIEAVKPIHSMPKLPVARVMWKLQPNFETGTQAWIQAGGAHHSVLSFSVTADMVRDYAEMAGIEYIQIDEKTNMNELKRDLMVSDLVWRLQ
jgi:L-arabinose isomerase